MAREWEGIPALRMDKFLYLCRCYVEAGFEWARRGDWTPDRIETFNAIMEEIPLSTETERPKMTNGLRYHVLDVWVDGLDACREEGEEMPLDSLLQPVRRLQAQARDKAVRKRAAEALNDERLLDWLGQLDGEGKDREDAAEGTNGDAVKKPLDEDAEDEWSGIEDG